MKILRVVVVTLNTLFVTMCILDIRFIAAGLGLVMLGLMLALVP